VAAGVLGIARVFELNKRETWRSLCDPDVFELAKFAERLFDVPFGCAGTKIADINFTLGSPISVSSSHLSALEGDGESLLGE